VFRGVKMLRASCSVPLLMPRKRGSFLCDDCGSSNGNRRATCKNCGKNFKRLKLSTTEAPFDCDVTELLCEDTRRELEQVFSVRVRPQGPDYRCFVTKHTSGRWICTYGDCQVAEQGRTRSKCEFSINHSSKLIYCEYAPICITIQAALRTLLCSPCALTLRQHKWLLHTPTLL
jgi:predicted RNA-binding Zn-ribbon protein involved in translation (DUF1610 family)